MERKDLLKKFALKEGDFVKVSSPKQNFSGTIIPSTDETVLALKLDSGYNVGISAKEVKEIKKVSEGKSVGKAKTLEIKKNPALPTISILHTGGTIASRIDYRTGAVVSAFEVEDLLTMFPELSEKANFESKSVSQMFSEDMRFSLYAKMAKAIEIEIKKGVKGIILGHGTDTMAYTSAALSFALENLPIPAILVGAQRSSDRGSSDAAMNLLCATEFILKSDFAGIAICMHENTSDDNCIILPACKTRKLHTSRRDAFKAVNDSPIARVNYKTKNIEFLKKDYSKKSDGKKLIVKENFEEKTAILKCHPNMFPGQFEFFKKEKFKGLVLEGTGLGQAPIGTPNPETKIHEKNLKAIRELIKSGCIVAMASQCIFGRVQMHVYSNAVDLANAGVISGEDMLAETAFVKLAWLLGNFKKAEAIELFSKNLRGEINERTPLDSIAENQ